MRNEKNGRRERVKAGTTLALILSAALSFAAEVRVDLRPSPQRARMANVEAQELGILRHASLSAGATSVDKLSVGDVIDFVLFDDVERTVVLKEKLDTPLGGAAFIGTVEGYEGMMNAVVVQSEAGLQVDLQDFEKGRVYTVSSSETAIIVREIDPGMAEVNPCDTRRTKLSADTLSRKLAFVQESFVIVDILVAYDIGAALWVKRNGGGIQSFAEIAVAKMNTALANNGLDSSFRFRLVGTMEAQAFANDVSMALDAISDGNPGWDKIIGKREEVGADIVTTLIDTGSAFGTTGMSWGCFSPEFFAENAYNVCAIRSVAQSHVMTHEVGHNMGAGHASADYAPSDPGPQLYEDSAGYYFTAKGTAYRTIMAYDHDNQGRCYKEAPLFSTPDVMWQGVPAGDKLHNNARALADTCVAASKWRENKVPYSYQVVFLSNNGEELEFAETHVQGEVFNLPACSFTPPKGKRFTGWMGANGKRYDDKMLVFDISKYGENITFTAIWE